MNKEENRQYLADYGKHMRSLRKRKGLSQLTTAHMLGISQAIISHIEQGYFLPPLYIENKLYKIYGYVKGGD